MNSATFMAYLMTHSGRLFGFFKLGLANLVRCLEACQVRVGKLFRPCQGFLSQHFCWLALSVVPILIPKPVVGIRLLLAVRFMAILAHSCGLGICTRIVLTMSVAYNFSSLVPLYFSVKS